MAGVSRAALAMLVALAAALGPAHAQAPKPAPSLEPAPVEESAPPPTVDELVDYFDTIVFGSEFSGVAASIVVKKWARPLRVAIRAFDETKVKKDGREVVRLRQVKVKKPHVRFVVKHLKSLVRETGLKTEDSKESGEPPNFVINIVPRKHMGNPNLVAADPKLLRRLAAEGGCFFLVWSDNTSGEIEKAVIVVNAGRLLIRINHCLLEEMTQSLGLPNDSNAIDPSIFSDRSRRTDLTRTDRIILKTLYDSRMPPGMAREQALPLARQIITELNASLR